jgi:hypothetical protein
MYDFKNGDKVKYSYGLIFTFIGLDPDDNTHAYCLHPTATYKICESSIDYKVVNRLP